jgi:hypothetical protein
MAQRSSISTSPGIDRAVQKFGDLLQGADVGLFYYAGHGVQVRGGNYLVPVDANPTRESDVDFQMLDTNLVLRQMADAGTAAGGESLAMAAILTLPGGQSCTDCGS